MTEQKSSGIKQLLNNWKAVLALIAVFILVFELFAMGLLGSGSIFGKPQEKQAYGGTEFQGSIRTYEPFLFISSKEQLGGNIINEIKEMPGVTQLTTEAGGIIIHLDTRDDVYPVAVALRKKNITAYSLANIAAPAEVPVLLENGQVVNASWSVAAVRAETLAVIPVDSVVTVKMMVLVEDNKIIQYGNAIIKTDEKTLSFEGEVLDEKIRQVFYVPWEKRNDVDLALFENMTFSYEKSSLAIFSEELPVEKTVLARQLDYVVYVDKKSAVFADNFTDAGRASADLGVPLVFQPSLLTVEGGEEVELPYNSTRSYLYEIKILLPEYYLPEEFQVLEIESREPIAGQKVNMSAMVSAVGPVVLDIENVTLAG